MKTIVSWFFRVLAIVGAGAALFFYLETQGIVKEARDAKDAEAQAHTQTKAKLSETEQKLSMTEGRLQGKEQELSTEKGRVSEVTRQLAAARRESAEHEKEKNELDQKTRELTQKVSQLNKELIEERTKVPDIDPREFENAKKRVAELEKKIKEVTSDLEAAQAAAQKASAAPTLATTLSPSAPSGEKSSEGAPAKAPVPSGGIQAKVLANRPQMGLIVIDAGSDKGVKEGVTLTLTKDGRLMARVRVTRVLDNQCVGSLIPGEGIPYMLRDNDSVSVSL